MFKTMVEDRKALTMDEFFDMYAAEIDPEGKHPVQTLGSMEGVQPLLLAHVQKEHQDQRDLAAASEKQRVLSTHPGIAERYRDVVPLEGCRKIFCVLKIVLDDEFY